MAIKHRQLITSLFLCAFSAQQILPAYACGPFFPEPVFAYSNHPDLPLRKFAQGNLGILQPGLAMSYLVIAYRYLTNNPLNADEQNAVISLWHKRLEYSFESENALAKPWLAIRNTVPGVKKLSSENFSVYKYSSDTYQDYTYCIVSTFTTAINTLKARIAKYGIKSPQVKFWLANQDRVFQNCGTNKTEAAILPLPPASKSDNLSQADYAYQLAAANFYADNFETARNQFAAIAKNSQSPWQKLAAYMVARTIFLQNVNTLESPDWKKPDANAIAAASKKQIDTEAYLQKFLKDNASPEYQNDIRTLLHVLEFRLHPMQRYHQLVRAVLQPNSKTFEQDLNDYTLMLDSFLASPDSPPNTPLPSNVQQMHDEAIKDDLTNWLFTFADTNERISQSKWQSIKSLPWLIVALSHANKTNPASSQLRSAAQAISEKSPAYLTLKYYAIVALGNTTQARQQLDYLLKQNLACMTPSAYNMLLCQRQQWSDSLSESIKYALKKPVAALTCESYKNIPDDFDKVEQSNNYTKPLLATFDTKMTEAINTYFPLSLWQELAANKLLSSKIHNEVLASTWVRAILLDNNKAAEALTPMLQTAYPAIKQFLSAYLAAQNPIEKRFAACYVLIRGLGLSPYIRGGLGRFESNILERDEFGDNFWTPLDPSPAKENETQPSSDNSDGAVDDVHLSKFITPAQASAATREAKILYTSSTPSRFITEAILAMAKYKPTDPRIPQALFVATKMPRWGGRLPGSTQYSKMAFELLHSKYANSSWAERAQYYY